MRTNTILFPTLLTVLLCLFPSALWADPPLTYHRPQPLMDYVPQEVGMYDTDYGSLNENDCRSCHGDSLVDRHHDLINTKGYGCADCHGEDIIVIRDCTNAGCHSWNNVLTNGWHHDTDLAASGNCVTCHDPSLITQITPFVSFSDSPPSSVTPTPFACDNCHWEQGLIGGDPGHPSTYHHEDAGGEFVFYKYKNPIENTYDTHHMGFKGDVASDCPQCHALDPNSPSWDPLNPELIRYCERCHSPGTLHTIHAGGFHGWEAVGHHVSGKAEGPPEQYSFFYEDEACISCHTNLPALFIDKVKRRSTEPGTVIRILGYGFGNEQGASVIHFGKKVLDASSPKIKLWSSTRIKVRLFNYHCTWFKGQDFRRLKVWVTVDSENSNRRKLKVLKPVTCP